MTGRIVTHSHILIKEASGEISLDKEYIIGVTIGNRHDDATLTYGLNESPKIPIEAGEPDRAYGGFHVCGVPCALKGVIRWKFPEGTVQPSGLVILSILTDEDKEI